LSIEIPSDRVQQRSWVHFALIALGWFLVGIGLVGVFLPVLPTTPFVLLALWCFARSSRRFHDWLYHHPRLGPLAQAWVQHRVVPLRAKLLSVSMMAASLLYVTLAFADSWWLPVVLGLTMGAVAAYILTRPSRVPLLTSARE